MYDILTADEPLEPVPRYYLVGAAKDDPVELPKEIYQVLRHAVDAMQKGLSVPGYGPWSSWPRRILTPWRCSSPATKT